MDNNLIITKELTPKGIKYAIEGRIYTSNAEILQLNLDEALGEKQFNIVLNMSQVDYISSSGIRVILKAYMDAKKAGGKLEIEMPSESVRNILKITALEGMLVPSQAEGNA